MGFRRGSCDVTAIERFATGALAMPLGAFGPSSAAGSEDSGPPSQTLHPCAEIRGLLATFGSWSLDVEGRIGQKPRQWPSLPPAWARCHMFEAWRPSPHMAVGSSSAGNAIATEQWVRLDARSELVACAPGRW